MTLPAIQVLGIGSVNRNFKKLTLCYQQSWMNSDHTFRSIVIANFY